MIVLVYISFSVFVFSPILKLLRTKVGVSVLCQFMQGLGAAKQVFVGTI